MKEVVGAVSIIVILLALLFCELTVVLDSVKDRVGRQRAENMELHETVAFSCGYLYGQRAIWRAAKLPPDGEPRILDHCTAVSDIAAKNGFSLAKD